MAVEVSGNEITSANYISSLIYFIKFILIDNFIKSKFITYFILLLIFGYTELVIISGFPSLIIILNGLGETKTILTQDFYANFIFFNIKSFELYILIFLINSFLKIYVIWYLSILGGVITNKTQNTIYEKIFKINKISINESEIRSILTNKIEFFYGNFILPFLFLLQAITLLFACIFALDFYSKTFILISLIILIILYLLIFILSKNNLKKNDRNIKEITTDITDKVDILLKDFRSIKANREYNLHSNYLNNKNSNLRKSIAMNFFLGNVPKNIIEIAGFAIFFVFLYSMQFINEDFQYLIILGTIGLISIRLLPTIQRVYWCFNNLYSTRLTWELIIKTLQYYERIVEIEKEKFKNININNFENIELNNITILDNKNNVLIKDFSYKFKKNYTYQILGNSGAGKTSLFDIIIGLRKPNEGIVKINNTDIPTYKYSKIFYISQENSLPNGKFINWFNGSDNISDENKIKLEKILKQDDLISIFPENIYEWVIKDNGNNLSLGQKQRLFILKAIWKNNEILFLDEPTSGLDKKNQKKYMKLIIDNCINSTIFLISHNNDDYNNFEKINLSKLNVK